jgi:hypothetical protein
MRRLSLVIGKSAEPGAGPYGGAPVTGAAILFYEVKCLKNQCSP